MQSFSAVCFLIDAIVIVIVSLRSELRVIEPGVSQGPMESHLLRQSSGPTIARPLEEHGQLALRDYWSRCLNPLVTSTGARQI